MFWVISVYFNIRNTLPKSGTFLLGHPVYLGANAVNMQMALWSGEGTYTIFNLGPKIVFRRISAQDIRAVTSSVFIPSPNTEYLKLLYVQVTVHRDKLRIKQPTRCIKYSKFILSQNSTCFGHLLCTSSGVIYCTLGNWYVSCRLCDRFPTESGWNNLTLLGSGHIACMKGTICRVYSRQLLMMCTEDARNM